MDCSKADVDVAGVDRFKVLNRRDTHAVASDVNVLIEQVFDAGGIKKVIFCLFDDVC